MKTLCTAVLLMVAAGLAQASEVRIGFQEVLIPDAEHGRPLTVAVWYPTRSVGTPQLIGANPVFFATLALQDAAPAAGARATVTVPSTATATGPGVAK